MCVCVYICIERESLLHVNSSTTYYTTGEHDASYILQGPRSVYVIRSQLYL